MGSCSLTLVLQLDSKRFFAVVERPWALLERAGLRFDFVVGEEVLVLVGGNYRDQECFSYRPSQSAAVLKGLFDACTAGIEVAAEPGNRKTAEVVAAVIAEASAAEAPAVDCSGRTGSTAVFVVLVVAELAAGSHHRRTHFAAALATPLSDY